MRQKQREMSQSFEETRPLSSEASEIGFDENGSMAVNRRDKSRVQIQVLYEIKSCKKCSQAKFLHINESS